MAWMNAGRPLLAGAPIGLIPERVRRVGAGGGRARGGRFAGAGLAKARAAAAGLAGTRRDPSRGDEQ